MQLLFDAVSARDLESVRAHLQRLVTDTDRLKALSALHVAVDADLPEIVEVYREAGFDLNTADMSGGAPLIWAARRGREAIVRLLLATGTCTIDVRDADNMTPLLHAAFGQHLEIVKLLVESGADISLRNSEGHSALDLARQRTFSVPAVPVIDQGFGSYRTLSDSPLATYLKGLGDPA